MEPQDGAFADGTTDAPRLGRLGDLDDYQVADRHPDVRGWDVKTADGRTVGKVDELIADTGEMRVRYVDVELDRSLDTLAHDAVTPGDQERHLLLPIGSVRLDDEHDDVLVDGLTVEQIAVMPRYAGGDISVDYERSLRTRWLGDTAVTERVDYAHTDFDDRRPYATRRPADYTGGPLSRLADRVDDVKDRIDGNPASRPGPDATDR